VYRVLDDIGTIVVMLQLRVYKATPDDDMEDTLMDLTYLVRLAVDQLRAYDGDYMAEIIDEEDDDSFECVEEAAVSGVNDGACEAFIPVKVWAVS
jgi:hypothetical protein